MLRPSVMMQLTLSSGRVVAFEVPLEQFHQLRYSVAKVLKGMAELRQHPVMRIAFEADAERLDEEGAGAKKPKALFSADNLGAHRSAN